MSALCPDVSKTFPDKANAGAFCHALQRIGNVVGVIGNGKHALAALGFERHARLFKKILHGLRRKGVQRAFEEARIGAHLLQKFLRRAVIRNIAPALSGDAELLPRFSVRLEDRYRKSTPCRRDRRHKPGGSGAGNYHISH